MAVSVKSFAKSLIEGEMTQAQRRRISLAEREGNHQLAREMRERWCPGQIVDLPHSASLSEMLKAAGGRVVNPGTPQEWVEATGVHRRLMAGLNSFQRRGIGSSKWRLEGAGDERTFVAESDAGCWSGRAWRVRADIRLTSAGVSVRRTAIAVRSSSGNGEWTFFCGGPLDREVKRKIALYLETQGVKAINDGLESSLLVPDEVGYEERRGAHDIGGAPWLAVMHTSGTRVVLHDDYGDLYLYAGSMPEYTHEIPAEILRELRVIGWRSR